MLGVYGAVVRRQGGEDEVGEAASCGCTIEGRVIPGGCFLRALRVIIQQPALPAYRVPVFATLARRPGIQLHIAYANTGLAPNVAASGFSHGFQEDRVVGPKSKDLRWSQGQWANAARGACDVMVLEWNVRVLSLVPTMIRARLNGIGVVLWGHGKSRRANGLRRALRNMLTRGADSVVVYSHAGREYLLECGLDPKRVFVAQNTQDQGPIQAAREQWLSKPAELRAFQEREGITERPVVVFSSTFMFEKRPDLLIEATALLVQQGVNVLSVLIGVGPMDDVLRARVRELKLENNVRFLGSVYREDAIAPWFLSARVMAHPRTIGLSVLHAFGYGLPVITSDDMPSHHPEIGAFKDRQTGLLFKDGDAASLAQALRTMIEDDQLRAHCSAEAHRVATQDFTLATMVNGLEESIRYAWRRRHPKEAANEAGAADTATRQSGTSARN